jgi:long-chain acyl-CoA synthetase
MKENPMSQPTRLFDLIRHQQQHKPIPDSLAAKVGGTWKKYSTADVILTAEKVATGLHRLGVRPGDKVAIISMNRPEWNFLDLGIQMLGAASVPIYPTATREDYQYILNHAEVQYVFAETRAIYEKVGSVRANVAGLKECYTFDQVNGARHWQEILPDSVDEAVRKMTEAVTRDSLASIIYTSGTTGTPKGVMLTHANILSNVLGVAKAIPGSQFHKALSFLPLSHVFERTVNYFYQYHSVAIYYAESIDTVADNLKEVGPDVFVTVPRLLEKVFQKIQAKGADLTGVKKKLFDWSMKLGLAYQPDMPRSVFNDLQIGLARKLVFSKWQEALGGHVRVIVVGGSALQARLARVFWAAGIRVVEGYGMTETAPVVACNRPDDMRIGTVGATLPGVEVRIKDEEGYPKGEGEILVRGPNVMSGYFKNPEATREMVDEDGWLRTGDIGTLVDGKYLKITDRKKEMFKTSGGKYIAPLAIEGKFKESRFVENVMVAGENQKFPSALIVPNLAALKEWASGQGLAASSRDALIADDKVQALFSDEIQRLNQSFGHWEQIKKFRLVSDEWTTESGELTPKLSLKRRVIAAKYKDLIESMYK